MINEIDGKFLMYVFNELKLLEGYLKISMCEENRRVVSIIKNEF